MRHPRNEGADGGPDQARNSTRQTYPQICIYNILVANKKKSHENHTRVERKNDNADRVYTEAYGTGRGRRGDTDNGRDPLSLP